ncbi:hypothetical protein BD626DRAFT_494599 [Schizophyllum amplum]|uniref:MYND-type domain-containing protein n=1 Tax=Schizophyllum amplum TaxID=97359 RepID=A0A550CFF7_9AGAR|nr:hypothetical protein BD626DRAFT_494599 [Auriculariopsis ampla]
MSSSDTPEYRCCAICAYPAPSRCSGCGKAFYCSKEHQTMAWAKHKRLCKIFQRENCGEPVPPADAYCGLCGKESGPFRKTQCCNRTICDDYGNYTPFTFGNNSCSRNHDRYTRCCYHFNEGHPGKDPLACAKCSSQHDAEHIAWYMANNYNFQEDILRANPPSFEPKCCTSCGKQVKQNAEAVSFGGDGLQCGPCTHGMVGGPGGVMPENTYTMDHGF